MLWLSHETNLFLPSLAHTLAEVTRRAGMGQIQYIRGWGQRGKENKSPDNNLIASCESFPKIIKKTTKKWLNSTHMGITIAADAGNKATQHSRI